MDGNGQGLDRAMTRPGILETCKLTRNETTAICTNEDFSAIIVMHENHLVLKKQLCEATLATEPERTDMRRHGSLALTAAGLALKHAIISCRLSITLNGSRERRMTEALESQASKSLRTSR